MFNHLGVVLITHPKSKYLGKDGTNSNFLKLVETLKISRENIYIVNQQQDYIVSEPIKNKIFYVYELLIFIIRINLRLFKRSKDLYNAIFMIYTALFYLMTYVKIIIGDKILKKNNFERVLNRQMNISFSHVRALNYNFSKKIKWLMIVEDDIIITEVKELYESMQFLIEEMEENNFKIANASQSFDENDLGLKKLRKRRIISKKNKKLILAEYSYISVNTVCATIYSRKIVGSLLKKLREINRFKLVPIDYKISEALALLTKENKIKSNDYVSLINSPIVQGSMNDI
jgi:hypothetical protein